MRIIRFIDETGQPRFGKNFGNNEATLLEGDSITDLVETDQICNVKKLLAPIVPTAIIGIGLNYHQHAQEIGMETPKYPVVFMKNPASIANPGDPILLHSSCMEPPEVDYEAELAVVIGQTAKNVSTDNALKHVLGYTAANDVSARRWQGRKGAGQWVRSKRHGLGVSKWASGMRYRGAFVHGGREGFGTLEMPTGPWCSISKPPRPSTTQAGPSIR